jgi:hypothetical protein
VCIPCKDTNKSGAKANLFDFAEREYLRRSANGTNKFGFVELRKKGQAPGVSGRLHIDVLLMA